MPGNPLDYESIEDDFMEFNPTWGTGTGYSSTIHDFSGTIASGPSYNLTNSNTTLPVTSGTDFTQWHTYGLLWVPASAANGWIGYRQAFFDGVAQAAVCWQGNQVGTFPPSGSYVFSLKDQDQFEIIFGGCATGTACMQIDYVHVYAVNPSSVTVVPAEAPASTPVLPGWALAAMSVLLFIVTGRSIARPSTG
jgi:hypothetical protein